MNFFSSCFLCLGFTDILGYMSFVKFGKFSAIISLNFFSALSSFEDSNVMHIQWTWNGPTAYWFLCLSFSQALYSLYCILISFYNYVFKFAKLFLLVSDLQLILSGVLFIQNFFFFRLYRVQFGSFFYLSCLSLICLKFSLPLCIYGVYLQHWFNILIYQLYHLYHFGVCFYSLIFPLIMVQIFLLSHAF